MIITTATKMIIALVAIATVVVIIPSTSEVMAQQSGYQMAVSVASHGFGESSVHISVDTENGFHDSKDVSTQGGATALFNIPPGEGSVKVCANFQCTTVDEGTTQVTINGAG